jgi:hypothetical protein
MLEEDPKWTEMLQKKGLLQAADVLEEYGMALPSHTCLEQVGPKASYTSILKPHTRVLRTHTRYEV